MPNDKPPRTWLTVEEVADQLRVSKMTVYRLVSERKLAAIQFGGGGKRTIRIPAAAMQEFVAANWVGDAPDGFDATTPEAGAR